MVLVMDSACCLRCVLWVENNSHAAFGCWGTENVARIPLRFQVEGRQGRLLHGRSAFVSWILERSQEDGQQKDRGEY